MRLIALSGWKKSGKDSAANYIFSNYKTGLFSFAGPLKDNVSKNFDIPREDCDNQSLKEKPILRFPINPQDDFSLTIAKFMVKEFRTEDGLVATEFHGCSKEFPEFDNMGLVKLNDKGEYGYRKIYQTIRSLCIIEGSTKRSIDSSFWVKQAIDNIEFNLNIENQMGNNDHYIVTLTDMRYRSEASQLKERFNDKLVTVRVNRFDNNPSTDPSECDLDDYEFDYVIENKGTLEELYKKIDALMETLKCQKL